MNSILSLAAATLLLASPKDGPAKPNQTMKGLMKDALAPDAKPSADGGTGQLALPDVSRMPFTPDSIKQVVTAYMPQIQGCYEEALAAKEKDLQGKLMTAFDITPEGQVTGAVVEKKGTSLKDPALHECVVTVLSAMQFPKPADGKKTRIEFPFNLKSVH